MDGFRGEDTRDRYGLERVGYRFALASGKLLSPPSSFHHYNRPYSCYPIPHGFLPNFYYIPPHRLRTKPPFKGRRETLDLPIHTLASSWAHEERETGKSRRQLYLDHYARVKELVPPERLLCHVPQKGWEPLCRFLDEPVPKVPYPNVNNTDESASLHARLWWMSAAFMVLKVVVAPVALAGAVFYGWAYLPKEMPGGVYGSFELSMLCRLSRTGKCFGCHRVVVTVGRVKD